MNNYSPLVGLLDSIEFCQYYKIYLEQLNINYRIVNKADNNFDFLISSQAINPEEIDLNSKEKFSGFVVTVARSKQGQIVVYPVASFNENEVIIPAINLSDSQASNLQSEAIKIASKINLEGAFEVVFFNTSTDLCKVNSLPTFLSLWTLDGANTSIFENHIRGLLNLPLGSPKLLDKNVVTVNIIGGNYSDMYRPFLHIMARDPELKVHLYQKEMKLNEIIGHVSLKGKSTQDLLERTHHAADYLNGKITE